MMIIEKKDIWMLKKLWKTRKGTYYKTPFSSWFRPKIQFISNKDLNDDSDVIVLISDERRTK